jgi:small subunit ribosomal protein S17
MTKTIKKTEESKKGRKQLVGTVVSDKMKDTIVVEVSRFVKHPKYDKYISIDKRFKADDKGNTKKVGDKVTIEECAPISKDKKFRVI